MENQGSAGRELGDSRGYGRVGMRVRTFPTKLLPVAALFILLLTGACGGDEATPVSTEAGQPVSSSPAVAPPSTTVQPPAQPPKPNPTPAAIPGGQPATQLKTQPDTEQ